MDDIRKAIQEIARSGIPVVEAKLGQVVSVQDDRTCTVKIVESELEISGVRCQVAIGSNSGVYIKPQVGSKVLVIEKEIPFICLYSDVELIELGGSDNGGLCITPTLKEELDKTNDLLQALISVVNGSPVPEPGNGSPSALQTALKSAITGKTLGNYDEIENANVTH
jgi:hypothetical protein